MIREYFNKIAAILISLLCLTSSNVVFAGDSTNWNRKPFNLQKKTVKFIQPGESVQAAIDSSVDATDQIAHVFYLSPGVYDFTSEDIVLKENVHIRGFSPGSTIIETGYGKSIIAASNSSINDLTIKYGGVGTGAITQNSPIENFVLDRVEFEITGNNAAVYFTSGGFTTLWMYDVKIVTEGTGIYATTWGAYYLHDVDIFLTGNNVGSPHIGIQINSGSRFYIWGSKIGTGYGHPDITNDTDQDIIGIYIPSSNGEEPRVEIHGLESFCKNQGALPGVNVNVIRVEAGWVRCFGCFGQSETIPDWNIGSSLYQSGNGKIEVKGSRFSSYSGNIFGSPQRGVSNYNTSHDGHGLEKFEGGLILLDATDGPFTINLMSYPSKGQEYIFKKVDSSNNIITISGNGALIDGEPSRDLTFQFEVLKIIGGYGFWHLY